MLKIFKITEEELCYSNENGEIKKIIFKECNKNWINYRKRNENLEDSEIDYIIKTDKRIGQRDICASPMYIEFFTRPFVRFEFTDSEAENKFKEVKEILQEYGWETIDLS